MLIYKFLVHTKAKGFDVDFYRSHYTDLKFMSDADLLRHYIRNGRSENRSPNENVYRKKVESLQNSLPGGFDLSAYKFYNADLLLAFVSDDEFLRHFIDHGLDEGRRYQFDEIGGQIEVVAEEDKWMAAFSPSEFIAWCGDRLDLIPTSREEALRIFHDQGIEQLWPINFEYAFDAEFVRKNNIMAGHEAKTDSDLYRDWLARGFPAGLAPNEGVFLSSYLGRLPFPAAFDWRGFARSVGLPPATQRSQVLAAFFDQPADSIARNAAFMGKDAGRLLENMARRALARQDFKKAVAVLEQTGELARTAGQLFMLGNAHRALGATDAALEAYAASIAEDGAPFGAYINSADIYAAQKEFTKAFAVMRAAFPHWRQKAEFGHKLRALVQSYFEVQSARAHALLAEAAKQERSSEHRLTLDALLTGTLDDIQTLFAELESLPAPIGCSSEGHISILANDGLRQCAHYRVEQKVLQFNSAGIPVRVFPQSDVQRFIDSLVGARAAIFYRVAATPEIIRAILHANSMAIDTYYEIDDLIFDSSCYPDPFESFEGQITAREYAGLQFGVPLFKYAMAMCKGSIASTPALAERMQKITKTRSSILIRNGLDERNDVALEIGAHPIRNDTRRIRIFYGSGTKAHNADFNKLAGPALLELMARYPLVDLVIVGHLKLMSQFSELGARIITFPFVPDLTTYWSILASCDINLAVLEPGAVADCKSEIKWLEAAVLQIPSIVSDTRTYREVVDDGVDGFLANSPERWHEMLERLIVDPQLRASAGKTAREKALRDYPLNNAAEILTDHFGRKVLVAGKAAPTRFKVLVCNVFFAPQSYGGATRVVEDNVRTFQSQNPDVEVAVLCSDEGASPAGRLTLGSEDGVPVYRLSVPRDPDLEWRPFNDDHAASFGRILDHFRPDIIHFHCIQRLTATIVEVALQRDIPYLVTVHDAWWLSDHQFLIDEDGFLRLPGTDVLADCENSRHGAASIARRHRLTSLLQKAHAVLSVSAPFAEIYANSGLVNVRVVENGTPYIEVVEHLPRTDGRIALGHIGGRSAHKGAALIEAVLRRNEFNRLHLTMVEGALEPGQTIETIWGTTPVTLTAPRPQSEVAQLYGALDVLLAPSTWPESFGLVTREALQCGLWVVASNLGAIGRDIVEGQNGNIIDVVSTEGLCRALREIDNDPASITSGRRSRATPPKRRPEDQAAEIYAIYRELVPGR